MPLGLGSAHAVQMPRTVGTARPRRLGSFVFVGNLVDQVLAAGVDQPVDLLDVLVMLGSPLLREPAHQLPPSSCARPPGIGCHLYQRPDGVCPSRFGWRSLTSCSAAGERWQYVDDRAL